VRTAVSNWSTASPESRLGVPPPMKMVAMRRPQINGSDDSRSAISAAMYSPSGMLAPALCELKSQ
jgi:hypothetical protein